MLPPQQLYSVFVLPMKMFGGQDCADAIMAAALPKAAWAQSPSSKHHNRVYEQDLLKTLYAVQKVGNGLINCI